MRTAAIYAGSFDPLTLGHLDIAERASRIFEQLIVAVAASTPKQPLFSVEDRVEMVASSVSHLDNVRVTSFSGLLVDYARQEGARVLVRGIRAFSDFENEFQMALINRKLAPQMETMFLMPRQDYSAVSSSAVCEIAGLGGDTSIFVPTPVQRALDKKFSCIRNRR